MVREIRVYVEGGGDSVESRAEMRKGFTIFFNKFHAALERRIHVIACGTRSNAYRDFMAAWEDHPGAFHVLLVDSEIKVTADAWRHLASHDQWSLEERHHEHCHLMVQIMEAWFLADKEALITFFGQGFREEKLPQSSNVESITKGTIDVQLRAATRPSEKGRYHKIRHAPKILALLELSKVRAVAPHCDRLLAVLAEKIGIPS
jgi:hypothetical protein